MDTLGVIGILAAGLIVIYVIEFIKTMNYDTKNGALRKKAAEEKQRRIQLEFEKLQKEIEDAKAKYSTAKRKLNESDSNSDE